MGYLPHTAKHLAMRITPYQMNTEIDMSASALKTNRNIVLAGIFATTILIGVSQPSFANEDLFQGCQNHEAAPGEVKIDNKERLDPISERRFASLSLNELADVTSEELANHCWFRLDGVWVEEGAPIQLNNRLSTKGFSGQNGSDIDDVFLHSVYTRPDYLIVEPSENPNEYLNITHPFFWDGSIRLESDDGIALSEVLKRGGPDKEYTTSVKNMFGKRMKVDVSRSSARVRLTLGDTTFVRPIPRVTKAERDAQDKSTGSWDRGAVMKNLRASRQGYDVTTQDPTTLYESGKKQIFAEHGPRDYYVYEDKIIPIGLRIERVGRTGHAQFSTMQRSATEIREAVSSSFGTSTRIGIKGQVGPENGKAEVDASVGWGSGHSNDEFSSLQESNSVAQATAYTRHLSYALIRDYAYSTLDETFQDAIYDAVESGDFKKIVRDFGTHYPYAMTYGAAGEMKHRTTKTGYLKLDSASNSSSENLSVNFLVGEHQTNSSENSNRSSSFERNTEHGHASFQASGGNGSWNENGFSAGEIPYPILADLRPLTELLSPMNFPNEPEIYDRGREELADEIQRHMVKAARNLKRTSLRPDPAKQVQKWQFVVRGLKCFAPGTDEGSRNRVQIKGIINIRFPGTGQKHMKAWNPIEYQELQCNRKPYNTFNRRERGRFFFGTPAEIAKMKYQVHVHLQEVDWGADSWDGIEMIRRKPTAVFNFPTGRVKETGDKFNQDVTIHTSSNNPQLKLEVEFVRIN